MKKILIWVAAVLLAFLAGYVPGHLKVRDLEKESTETRRVLELELAGVDARYRVSQIHSRLGMLILEAEQHNYATALKQSTALFDEVAETIPEMSEVAQREALTKMSKQRDAVTSALTISSPEAATRLKQIYAVLGTVTLAVS